MGLIFFKNSARILCEATGAAAISRAATRKRAKSTKADDGGECQAADFPNRPWNERFSETDCAQNADDAAWNCR